MVKRWTSAAAVTAILCGAPTWVAAQDEDAARAAFADGDSHYQDGRFLMAATSYRQAWELAAGLETRPLIGFNIARSLERAPGHECEAREWYERFSREGDPNSPEVQERLATVQERLRELDARIASAGGCAGSISPVGGIVLGVGGAAVIVGSILGGLVIASDMELQAMCGDDLVCPSTARSRAEEQQRLSVAADVMLFGGAAIAVTGLVLLFVLRDGGAEPAVAAWFAPDSYGLVVGGVL